MILQKGKPTTRTTHKKRRAVQPHATSPIEGAVPVSCVPCALLKRAKFFSRDDRSDRCPDVPLRTGVLGPIDRASAQYAHQHDVEPLRLSF